MEQDLGQERHVDNAQAPPFQAPPSSLAPIPDPAPLDETRINNVKAPDTLPKTGKDEVLNTPVSAHFEAPLYSAQTESLIKRINANAADAAARGTPGFEAAKEQIMKDMQTSDKFPTPPPRSAGNIRGGGIATGHSVHGDAIATMLDVDAAHATPGSKGRGRGGGRPRGRGRGGGRGGKRKREDNSDEESDDSEVYTPGVTMTKSGRSVQKPTSFVPPPASPVASNKRKRPYRKNPESAVCKMCLRGTSPATNMIVFCDGCNTPYHRYCHHPPIDQTVVDEVDKEWYCKQCERERVLPVPEAEVADFRSAEGASVEQRQKYFASLPPGILVTLLTKATTIRPDLPVFAPDFQARARQSTDATSQAQPPNDRVIQQPQTPRPTANTLPAAPPPHNPPSTMRPPAHPHHKEEPVPDEHPPHYPRPGYGLMRELPPESEDLHWLVDDEDKYGVFTHMYQVDPQAADAGLNGSARYAPQ